MNEELIGDNYKNYGIEEVLMKPVKSELLRAIIKKIFPDINQPPLKRRPSLRRDLQKPYLRV